MSRTDRNTSPRGFAFGGASGLGDILASILGGPDLRGGKSLAKGADAIVAALQDIAKKEDAGISQSTIDDLKVQMADADNVELFQMPDNTYVIAGTSTKKRSGDGLGDFEGLDLGGLENAMRYSDRHGGRSGLDGLLGALRERLRRSREPQSPIDAFMRASKQASKDPPREKEPTAPSPAMSIMLAATTTAVELTRYARRQTEAPVAVAEAMAKLIGDIQGADATRFGNLDGHLIGYGVHLGATVEKLRQFARKPRVDTADDLAKSLALMMPIIVNVMRDAVENSEKAAKDALAI